MPDGRRRRLRIESLLSCELSKSFWNSPVADPAYGNGTVDVSWFTKTVASFLPLGNARDAVGDRTQ